MNIKEEEEQQATSKKISWKRMLFREYVILSNNIQFIIFITVLVLIYIHNGQVYEQKARKINVELKTIQDIEYEYKYVLQQWTLKTKESALEERLKQKQIKVSLTAPYLIKQ